MNTSELVSVLLLVADVLAAHRIRAKRLRILIRIAYSVGMVV